MTSGRAPCRPRRSPIRRLSSAAARCRLRRCGAAAGAWAQISRPARAGRLDGRLDGAAGAELIAEADMIVPVPLHRRRLWWRRFNQSAALPSRSPTCRKAARQVLDRIRATRQQVGLSGPSATGTCAAPSASRRRARAASPAAGCCSSTTSTRPGRRSRRRRGRSSAPARPPSMCSSLRGLCAAGMNDILVRPDLERFRHGGFPRGRGPDAKRHRCRGEYGRGRAADPPRRPRRARNMC